VKEVPLINIKHSKKTAFYEPKTKNTYRTAYKGLREKILLPAFLPFAKPLVPFHLPLKTKRK